MIACFEALRKGLSWLVGSSKRQSRSQYSANARLRPERLEERLALSVYSASAAAAPVSCCCPSCTGQGYVLAGQELGAAYATSGYKWSQAAPGATVTITYSYSNLLNGYLGGGLSAATIRATIEEALSRWASVAPFRFVEVADAGPMPSPENYEGTGLPMMRFGHRVIDGSYNVLAYGWYPSVPSIGIAGDVQFDTGENWTTNPGSGMDLLEVATHEIGHALGLGHEPMPNTGGQQAIMNPYYSGRYRGLGTSYLLNDDVNGIRALYGSGTGAVIPLSGSQPPGDPPGQAPSFVVEGNRLTVVGTSGDDIFRLRVTPTSIQISGNGHNYNASRSVIRSVWFQGNGGEDRAILEGGAEYERAYLQGANAALIGPSYEIFTRNVDTNTIYGTLDEVVDYRGVTGPDELWTAQTGARMSGSGYENLSFGFGQTWAHGDSSDSAVLADTQGDDYFVAKFPDSWINGTDYLAVALGFGTVDAQVTGGYDRAYLYDSAGNEQFISTPTRAWMTGPGGTRIATGFEWVLGTASSGYDQAVHYDSSGNDTFISTSVYSYMDSRSSVTISTLFDSYGAVMSTGGDVAHVYDSAGDDGYTTSGTQALLTSATREVVVSGADVVAVYGSSGRNRRSLGNSSFQTVFQGTWI